jgi:CheY-like chemotaxis protein
MIRQIVSRVSKRILIVEDNPDTAFSLAKLLELSGHTVSVAHTGQEGLAAAFVSPPDVAILDIGLPGMDGHELARQLRTQLSGAPCLLIAATAYSRPEDVARSMDAGFDVHFVKPVPLVRFLELIDP